MGLIYLGRDIRTIAPSVEAPALCVCHKDYDVPAVDCQILTWDDFAKSWQQKVRGLKTLVVVGLNRIMSPSNRVKMGQMLLRPIDGVQRVSVDHTLFVSEPWRAFWHFSCVRVPYLGLSDSFLAETRWQQGQDGYREDPFALATILEHGSGVVTAHGPAPFDGFSVRRVEIGAAAHTRYQKEKELAFNEEHTSAAIIRRLSAVAAESCPDRSIPSTAALFKTRAPSAVQTDLAVDDYLIGRLRSLVELTNGIHEGFQPRT